MVPSYVIECNARLPTWSKLTKKIIPTLYEDQQKYFLKGSLLASDKKMLISRSTPNLEGLNKASDQK